MKLCNYTYLPRDCLVVHIYRRHALDVSSSLKSPLEIPSGWGLKSRHTAQFKLQFIKDGFGSPECLIDLTQG